MTAWGLSPSFAGFMNPGLTFPGGTPCGGGLESIVLYHGRGVKVAILMLPRTPMVLIHTHDDPY